MSFNIKQYNDIFQDKCKSLPRQVNYCLQTNRDLFPTGHVCLILNVSLLKCAFPHFSWELSKCCVHLVYMEILFDDQLDSPPILNLSYFTAENFWKLLWNKYYKSFKSHTQKYLRYREAKCKACMWHVNDKLHTLQRVSIYQSLD